MLARDVAVGELLVNCPSKAALEVAVCVSALRKDLPNGAHVDRLKTFAGGNILPGTLAFDSEKGYRHRTLWHDHGQ